MPSKYVLQQRGAGGLNTVAEIPALENGKIDMSWLPVVGESGAAIIARGSNANGEWVRWEDGTQVCVIQTTQSDVQFNQLDSSGWYKTSTEIFIFPAVFISPPFAVASVQTVTSNVGDQGVLFTSLGVPTTSDCWFRFFAGSQRTATLNVFVFAIGRWK